MTTRREVSIIGWLAVLAGVILTFGAVITLVAIIGDRP